MRGSRCRLGWACSSATLPSRALASCVTYATSSLPWQVPLEEHERPSPLHVDAALLRDPSPAPAPAPRTNFEYKQIERISQSLKHGNTQEAADSFHRLLLANQCPPLSLTVDILSAVTFSDMEQARQIFFDLPHSVASYKLANQVVQGYLKRDQVEQALCFFSDAQSQLGSPVDMTVYETLARALSHSPSRALIEVFLRRIVTQTDILTSDQKDQLTGWIIQYLCEGSHMERARQWVNWEYERDSASVSAFHGLILSFVYRDQVDKALQVIQEMRHKEVPRTAASYQPILTHWIKQRDYPRAYELLQEMKDEGITFHKTTYCALLQTGIGMRDAAIIEEAIHDAKSTPGAQTDFYVLLVRYLASQGDLPRVKETMEHVRVLGGQNRERLYKSLIRGLTDSQHFDEADAYLKECARLKVRVDRLTYTTLVHGHAERGHVRRTLTMLLEAYLYRVILQKEADVVSLLKLAFGSFRASSDLPPREAVEMTEQLYEQRGWNVSDECWQLLAGYCYDQGDEVVGQDVLSRVIGGVGRRVHHHWLACHLARNPSLSLLDALQRLRARGPTPEEDTFSVCLHAACQADQLAKAENVLRAKEENGHQASEEDYNALIRCAFRTWNLKQAQGYMKSLLKQHGQHPSADSMQVILASCLAHDETDKVLHLLDHMGHSRVRLDTDSLHRMMHLAADHPAVVDKLEDLLHQS